MDHTLKHKKQNYNLKTQEKIFGTQGKKILDSTPKAQSIKGNTGKLDFIKITNLCFVKVPVKRRKRQATEQGENIRKLQTQRRTSV